MLFRVLSILLLTCTDAWDPFGLKHAGQDAVNDLMNKLEHELLPEVQQAIREEVDHIFDDKLPVLISNVSQAVADLEDHAEEEAEKLLNYTMGNITNLMHETIDMVSKLVNQSVNAVKQAMDDFVDKHLTGLIDHVFAGVNELLTRVEQDVQQLLCEEQAVVKQLELFIDQELGNLDCECTLKVKTEWAQPCQCSCSAILPTRMTCKCSPASWATVQDVLAYEYIECVQRKAIESGILPVGKIITLLAGLRSLAEQLRCYHVAPDGPKADITMWYTNKILSLSQEKYIWQHPVALGITKLSASHQRKLSVQRRSLTDCTSKSPYECWMLAMQATEEAKQAYQEAVATMANKADMSDLNATNAAVSSLKTENAHLKALVDDLNGQLNALNQTLTPLKATIESDAHADAASQLAPVADQVSRLTGGLTGGSVVQGGYQSFSDNPDMCEVPNAATGGCSCPTGFSATPVGFDTTQGSVHSPILLCVKTVL